LKQFLIIIFQWIYWAETTAISWLVVSSNSAHVHVVSSARTVGQATFKNGQKYI